ncbi:hypothetical protein KKF63_05465 [bacterium]|nr:hypothetical protein [bacterium]
MNHTYLFQEAQWQAKGRYHDAQGLAGPFEGVANITHHEGVWKLDSDMRLCHPNTTKFHNLYEIKPFIADNVLETSMTSTHPVLGNLLGKVVVVEDSLLVFAHSEDHSHTIVEEIRCVDHNNYINHGAFFMDNKLIGSWVLNLTTEIQKLKLLKFE